MKNRILCNINMAARIVVEAVKIALGPKGMDNILVDSLGSGNLWLRISSERELN